MQVQAVAPNQKKKKERKIKMTSKLEKRKMECRQKDHIGKQIRMIVVVTVTRVVKENQFLSEGVQRHEKIEVDQRTEIDREIDHAIDHGIGLGIDLEIGIEGNYKYYYILQMFITIIIIKYDFRIICVQEIHRQRT